MSKDLTPRKKHQIDLVFGFSKTKLELVGGDGSRLVLHDPESSFSKLYPNLSYLGDSVFSQDISPELLSDAESTLATIIRHDDMPELDVWDNLISLAIRENKNSLMSMIGQWYYGKLDSDFYYHERNDEVLRDYITSLDKGGKYVSR